MLGAVLGAAVLAGFVLDVLTFVLARYGPQGSDGAPWSFRGNGALIVPFGLGPAVLAGAWTALALRARGVERWQAWGVIAAAAGATLIASSILLPMVFGTPALVVSSLMVVPVWVWIVCAPIVAMVVPLRHVPARGERSLHVLAAGIFGVAFVAAFFLAARILPPGS